MFKGIVFDLDGTLIDSPLDYAYIRRELKIPDHAFILEYLANLPDEIRQKQMIELERIENHAAQKARVIDGVHDVVSELKLRAMKLAVFTRNCRIATRTALEMTSLEFDLVITREDALPKPNPEGLFKIIDEWRFKPSELLYVGDFRFDIECGKAAGVRTALFTNNDQSAETFQADYVLQNYAAFFQMMPAGAFVSA